MNDTNKQEENKKYDVIFSPKPCKGGSLPPKWFCYDCETAGLYGETPLLICVLGNEGTEETFEGEDAAQQFKNWIDDHRKHLRNAHFYAHNAEFDLSKIFGNIIENKDLTQIFAGSQFISARYNVRTRTLASGKVKHEVITFLDSGNLLPKTSLSDIGDALGFAKSPTPEKWKSATVTVDQIDQEDRDYCMQDCRVLQRFIQTFAEFVEEYHISVKSTIAANAKAVWATGYLKGANLYIKKDLDEEFREAYYGGRTEVFISRLMESKLYHYDVNSLYPSVMKGNVFPDPARLRNYPNPNLEKLEKIMATKEGMANVTVIVPKLHIPLLPYRKGKLLFPDGRFTGSYCFPELREAVKLGYKIVEVHKVIAAPRMASPFSDYIKHFERIKIEASNANNEPMRQLAKLFMNSLYGKFAQRIPEEEQFVDLGAVDIGTVRGGWSVLPCGLHFRTNVKQVRSEGTTVCWASYVCSYARCKLFDYLAVNPEAVRYCDTDSMFTSIPLPEKDVNKTVFGKMNLEGMVSEHIFVDAKKYYVVEDGKEKFVLKGVSNEQRKLLTKQDLLNDEIPVEGYKPSKTKESLRKNISPYTKISAKKTLVRQGSPKRIFDERGDSQPITIK